MGPKLVDAAYAAGRNLADEEGPPAPCQRAFPRFGANGLALVQLRLNPYR